MLPRWEANLIRDNNIGCRLINVCVSLQQKSYTVDIANLRQCRERSHAIDGLAGSTSALFSTSGCTQMTWLIRNG